jgi:hypothetical protein
MKYKYVAHGYIALMSVIILGALGSSVMISLIHQSVITAKTDFETQNGIQAKILATACAEEALQTIVETGTSSWSDSLLMGNGTCLYSISKVSQNTHISATGLHASSTQRVLVILSTTSPTLVISSWQDSTDF